MRQLVLRFATDRREENMAMRLARFVSEKRCKKCSSHLVVKFTPYMVRVCPNGCRPHWLVRFLRWFF